MSTFEPPCPLWKPSFSQPIDLLVDRAKFYTNYERDFAVFQYGTIVILPSHLDDSEALDTGYQTLDAIFRFHPDMNPLPMNDGNILVQYNHPAINIVLPDFAQNHWAEIETRHLDGLVSEEVLITPLGPNQFDDFGKLALLGRSYMFMDAVAPQITALIRADAPPPA